MNKLITEILMTKLEVIWLDQLEIVSVFLCVCRRSRCEGKRKMVCLLQWRDLDGYEDRR